RATTQRRFRHAIAVRLQAELADADLPGVWRPPGGDRGPGRFAAAQSPVLLQGFVRLPKVNRCHPERLARGRCGRAARSASHTATPIPRYARDDTSASRIRRMSSLSARSAVTGGDTLRTRW